MNPEPCPFCGEELRPVYDQAETKVVSWQHPGLKEMRQQYGSDWWCFMQGNSIGSNLIRYWNNRPGGRPPVAAPPPPRAAFATQGKKWVSMRFTVNGGDQIFTLRGMVDLSDTKGVYNGD
jgi:hypothetical protein